MTSSATTVARTALCSSLKEEIMEFNGLYRHVTRHSNLDKEYKVHTSYRKAILEGEK